MNGMQEWEAIELARKHAWQQGVGTREVLNVRYNHGKWIVLFALPHPEDMVITDHAVAVYVDELTEDVEVEGLEQVLAALELFCPGTKYGPQAPGADA